MKFLQRMLKESLIGAVLYAVTCRLSGKHVPSAATRVGADATH
jgi:hypothetical protein